MTPDPVEMQEARQRDLAGWLRLACGLCLLAALVAGGLQTLRWRGAQVDRARATTTASRVPGPSGPDLALAFALPATLALGCWFAHRTRLSAIRELQLQRTADRIGARGSPFRGSDEPGQAGQDARWLAVPISRGRLWRTVLGLLILVPSLIGDALLLQLAAGAGLQAVDAALGLLAWLLAPPTLLGLLVVFYRSGLVLRSEPGWLFHWRGLVFPWVGRWIPLSDVEGVDVALEPQRVRRATRVASRLEVRLRSRPDRPLRLRLDGFGEVREQAGRIDRFLKSIRVAPTT